MVFDEEEPRKKSVENNHWHPAFQRYYFDSFQCKRSKIGKGRRTLSTSTTRRTTPISKFFFLICGGDGDPRTLVDGQH